MSNSTDLNTDTTDLRNFNKRPKFTSPDHSGKVRRERKFATDFFMIFTYSLLGFAVLSQVFLILWLEFI